MYLKLIYVIIEYLTGIYVGESITLVVFGIAKVQTVRMQALLSGLKLEAEMKSVHASGSYKEKAKGRNSNLFPLIIFFYILSKFFKKIKENIFFVIKTYAIPKTIFVS